LWYGRLALEIVEGMRRSYHDRQRDLAQASLIARWVPEPGPQRPER